MTYLELAQFIMSEMNRKQQNCDVTLVDVEFSEAFPAVLAFVEKEHEGEDFGLDIYHPFLYPAP